MFGDTRETETILLPALQAGLEALKASECVGKLYVFHSSLPNAEAPGKLKIRDDRKLLGTDKEKTVLTPQSTVYNMLAQDCVGAGVSVDLFAFNNAYIDLATIGQVARLTGGEVYKYTYFQADIDGRRMVNDLLKNISRPIAFDAVMRVRTSTGVRATDFYGHFFMTNTKDIEIASIGKCRGVNRRVPDSTRTGYGKEIELQLMVDIS
uniref:Sec23/Sec24 trunk domain-containing protein n=1 Tax=Anopheles maculatus TaxID=74869 RepID=A0A182S5P3_9DIPT